MPLGSLPFEVFWACQAWRKTWGGPRICKRYYISLGQGVLWDLPGRTEVLLGERCLKCTKPVATVT